MIDPQTLMIQPSFNEAGCVKQRYVRLPFSENLIGQGISSKQYVLDLTLLVQSKKIDFIQGLKINAYPRKDIGNTVSSDSETWDCCIDFGNGFKEFVSMEKGVGSINAFPIFVNNPPQVTITFFGRDGADLSTIYADFYFTNYLLRPDYRRLINKNGEVDTMYGANIVKTIPQSISNNVGTQVLFDSPLYDTNSLFDAVNSELVIKENAFYVAGGAISFNYASTGYRTFTIKKNGLDFSAQPFVRAVPIVSPQPSTLIIETPPLLFSAGDKITFNCFQNSGGPLLLNVDLPRAYCYIYKHANI